MAELDARSPQTKPIRPGMERVTGPVRLTQTALSRRPELGQTPGRGLGEYGRPTPKTRPKNRAARPAGQGQSSDRRGLKAFLQAGQSGGKAQTSEPVPGSLAVSLPDLHNMLIGAQAGCCRPVAAFQPRSLARTGP